jgi:hypothetical protein
MGEGGYDCIRIPDILLTMNNTLIAFGEARNNSCADNTWIGLRRGLTIHSQNVLVLMVFCFH